ncbi:spermatogenesis associated 2-like [Hippocampus comes]|uniref:Spermatogenesis associated 2 like n=1 Tax=Hippocampus comes TaxID=109280 RepID=A0A3Q2YS01_HIPCM|nr:PREDICTED: spermatogenesis-associated protein 2-like protein [Hippocampus comes]XP_019720838.1 PREDICTED: spermatogenesis-associated protein 2-like protein [Hippocampus comes]XP_019720839.1 PREDICTED: spermatogenesis-associated protein 2-like protein [Hippocampus comes]
MSTFHERMRHFVADYDDALEQQIVRRGSYLACSNEELWKQVEELLSNKNAQETHCLSLDPLKIMEESLKVEAALAKAPKASSGKQVKARRGLWGLAKAFEVLEQAALNLYLGPWREEYKVVKMYSGMFTHYIKPVLSLAQIEKLFGLLGYQRSTRREQLHLQLHTVSPLILDDLLCLSCAFYLARCECQLLLTALEAHGGDPRWELCMVRERLRGYVLQVALDNTKRIMGFKQPLMSESDEESDVDLYTDKQVNEGQRGMLVPNDDCSSSLSWGPLPVKLYHNGSLSSSSQAMKEYVSVSTLSCQVTSKSESEPFRGSSARVSQPSNAGGKITADSPPYGRQEDGVGMGKNEDESNHLCSSLQSPNLYLNQCIECNSAHNISSAVLQHYSQGGNSVLLPDDMKESAALSPPRQNVRPQALNLSLTLSSSAAAMSSLALCDNPKPLIPIYHPISYHDCCDLSHLDS